MRYNCSVNDYNRFFWVGKMVGGSASIFLLLTNLAIVINMVFDTSIKSRTLTISGITWLLFLACAFCTCFSHRQNKKLEKIRLNIQPGKAGNP